MSQLNEKGKLLDEEFRGRINQARYSVEFWWKNHFNLSSNSKEYLTATESQMLEDYIGHLVKKHIDNNDLLSEEIAIARAEDNQFDFKMNEEFKDQLKNIKLLSGKIKLD